MKKSLIVAVASNEAIGRSGELPWPRLPGDLPRFRRLTMGKPCIMGRRTFESLKKPLDGRLNIVVSRNPQNVKAGEAVRVVSSVLEGWIVAAESGADEAFIIGGAEVYKQALGSCERLYLTLISQPFDGDVFFELKGIDKWRVSSYEYVGGETPYQNLILDKGTPMAAFLTLERLEGNELPMPRYGTQHAAGLDFSACLVRPCKTVEPGSGKKSGFWAGWVKHNQPLPVGGMFGTTHMRFKDIPQTRDQTDLAVLIAPGETVLVSLGFKCSFDSAFVLNIYPRSSVGLKGLVLANGTGIIDPDYRGELFAALCNRTDRSIVVEHGERIVQGILTHFTQGIIREGKVDETARGEGGLGSTGKMAGGDLMNKTEVIALAEAEGLQPSPTPAPAGTEAPPGQGPKRSPTESGDAHYG